MQGGTGEHGANESRPVEVLIVDDQATFRKALRDLVAATPGLTLAGEADSGEAALEAVESLSPRMVIMDKRMPGIGGVEAARRITAAHPETVVVLISIEDLDEFSQDAQACGAAALVRKQDFGPSLLRTIWKTHGACD